jgi:hypothetical protein
MDTELFKERITAAARLCFQQSLKSGFWDAGLRGRNKGEMIALMHSELSEMLEGVRKPGPDTHCPEFSSEVIEAADTIIRIFDYCAGFDLPLADAILAKMTFNATRPHKHGKNF